MTLEHLTAIGVVENDGPDEDDEHDEHRQMEADRQGRYT